MVTKIVVVGTGYVGTTVATKFAEVKSMMFFNLE